MNIQNSASRGVLLAGLIFPFFPGMRDPVFMLESLLSQYGEEAFRL